MDNPTKKHDDFASSNGWFSVHNLFTKILVLLLHQHHFKQSIQCMFCNHVWGQIRGVLGWNCDAGGTCCDMMWHVFAYWGFKSYRDFLFQLSVTWLLYCWRCFTVQLKACCQEIFLIVSIQWTVDSSSFFYRISGEENDK